MIQFDPTLFIKRLVIQKENYTVYDEKFHQGVNIIRGHNSSGKSTIMELMFFALGGDIPTKQWKEIALKCSTTYIEIEINGKTFTLCRDISNKSRIGMRIFEGGYDDFSIKDSLLFPYSDRENKQNYHANLLQLLNIPIIKSTDNNFINFNQILRLIYTDQLTSVSRIFREQDFDSNTKREAIGDLLIGVISDLFHKKNELKEYEKDHANSINEIKTFTHVYLDIKTIDEINQEINFNQERISELNAQLEYINEESADNETRQEIYTQRDRLDKLLRQKEDKIDELNKILFEIKDSELFIKSQKNRLIDVQNSEKMINILSDLQFIHCPACFSKLKPTTSHTTCNVCGSEQSEEYEKPTYRLQKNIEFQIQETQSLLPKYQERYEESESELATINQNIDNVRAKLMVMEKPIGGLSTQNRLALLEIGNLEQQNIHLQEKIAQLSKFEILKEKRDDLQAIVSKLSSDIDKIVKKNEQVKLSKESKISGIVLDLIKQDLDREDSFKKAKEVSFSFSNDIIKVDGVSMFSASSTAFLKSCFKLALLIASCQDKSFLYPRLAIMDNIEDKGMEEARSKNFQKLIVAESKKLTVKHQIIFTTSMIAEELNNSEYCIGDFYTSENHTLKIKS
ncbi:MULTISPECIES: hypothetical protein [Moraxella]|jgi:hypothetical protein|uniref:Rad50/SbcC-type AAA domain-containing protein n=1 Tax=Moraxella lacunata TaxID=477 RepID=A0A1B8Q2D4_MORLA|nr:MULTISPECIES: hypothetical protein [Moraxella]MBE9578867.1 hypothetical protein [Moraxella sp. K1664]MBE9588521.1 hypothetical protein [Moraxella sp. K1630]MBE9589874.1 hypothetical protein [Moraxella sp. K127]MBE9596694.1 hypothetical protein [Moraxella sp. K2450]MDH9218826.1 hypothetical protein [Moraxella lacunata]